MVRTVPRLFDRVPPHSLEAEMSVLGSLILEPARLGPVSRLIDEGSFYDARHAAVYTVIAGLGSRVTLGEADLVLIHERLRDRGILDEVGGAVYLQQLAESVPVASNAEHYARIVRDKHRLRELIRVSAEAMYAAYDDPENVDEAIAGAVQNLLASNRSDGRRSIGLRAAELGVLQDLESGRAAMVPTGMGGFDLISGGVPRRGVWVVSGGPASGKTTTVLGAALRMALGTQHEPPRCVRVFSYEQSAQRIAATLLSQEAGCNVHGALNQTDPLSPDEKEAVQRSVAEHLDANFNIYEGAMNAEQILTECATHKEPGVCVVDYLQLLPPFGKFVEATPRITESMRVLVRIARELGWLVVIVSQIDKSASKSGDAPTMSDGLGSSAIEQYADLYSTVWRPNQKEPMPIGGNEEANARWRARQGQMRLSVTKNKYGPVGTAEVFFDGRSMRVRGPHPWEQEAWENTR